MGSAGLRADRTPGPPQAKTSAPGPCATSLCTCLRPPDPWLPGGCPQGGADVERRRAETQVKQARPAHRAPPGHCRLRSKHSPSRPGPRSRPLPTCAWRCCRRQAAFPSLALPPRHMAQGQGSPQLGALDSQPGGSGQGHSQQPPAWGGQLGSRDRRASASEASGCSSRAQRPEGPHMQTPGHGPFGQRPALESASGFKVPNAKQWVHGGWEAI